MHGQRSLVPHRDGRHVLIGDAQERSGCDYVDGGVLGEKLECRAGMGAFLDFVEKEQRLAGREGDIGNDQAQPFEDFGR